MRKIVAITILIMISLSLFANDAIVKGYINESKGTIFKITITSVDTTKAIVNVAIAQTRFEVPVPFEGGAIIEIKSDQKEEYSKAINVISTVLDLGEINLIKSGVNLDEVTVTGKKMQIERDGMDYIIRNIQGTHLGDAGNLMDMLKWTPGVIVKQDEDISIIGKGSPAIYINDRKIIDKSELLSLQSNEVSRIEIIREPGAKYNSGTSSVIQIYLRKPLKDYLGAALTNTTSIYRKVSDNIALNLNGKVGILSATASFRYKRGNGLAYDYAGTTIIHSENNIFTNNSDGFFTHAGNSYNMFGGLNFNFTPKSILTVQYSGNIKDNILNTDRTQAIDDNGKMYYKHNISDSKSKAGMHTLSSSYMLTRNATSKLSLVADYATRKSENLSNMNEHNITTGKEYNTLTSNKSDYDIYTFNGDYSFKIGKEDDEKIGAEIGHVNTTTDMNINYIPQNTERKNLWLAAFANFHRWWWKFNVSIGLRYEYDYTNTKIINNDGAVDELSKEYSNIFPNIRVAYMHKKGKVFAINYRRSISRPSFSSLSPIIQYEDSLHYGTGNPLLKPTFKDRVSLTFNFLKDITLNMEYIYNTDPIVNVSVHDDVNPNVLVTRPINIDNSHGWSLSADYSYASNRINLSAYAIMEGYYIKFPYLNEMKSYNKISAFMMFNFAYNFYRNYDFYASGYYQTPLMYGNEELGYTLGINFGVSAKFFNKKLYVAVDINDVFRKSVTPWWERRNNDTYNWRKNEYDTRGVDIKIRYTFNSIRDNFKKKSGNNDLLNRTND